jgi:hypothetical protein
MRARGNPEPVSPASAPPPTSLLDRAAQLPPHHLGIAYTAAACVGTTVRLVGERVHSPGLTDLGIVLVAIAGLVLYVIVTWYRDDDALAAGFLLALTLIIGSLAATVVMGAIVSRSLIGGIALLTLSPFVLVGQAFLLIPASAVLIWVARKVSEVIETMFGAPKRGPRP